MAQIVGSSPYIQHIPITPAPTNNRNIVSIPANHPDSINFYDLPQSAYLAQCWSLCQDIVKILPNGPLFQEAIKSLCNHKYNLKSAAVRSNNSLDGVSIVFKDPTVELVSHIYTFQNNDDSLVWSVFPDNVGDFGDCTRKKTIFSGEDVNLCHFTYIKGNNDPQTQLPMTISHPKGRDFNLVIQHCESLFYEILNPVHHPRDAVGMKGEEVRQKIMELQWWMGQGGLFKSNEKKHRLPQGQKTLPNINGPYIEIFIAALYLYKFKETPNYTAGQSTYHLSLVTSLEEFKNSFSQLVENRV